VLAQVHCVESSLCYANYDIELDPVAQIVEGV